MTKIEKKIIKRTVKECCCKECSKKSNRNRNGKLVSKTKYKIYNQQSYL